MKHVEKVLERLKEHRLFAKMSKCEFNKKSVEFLGHIVSDGSVKMQKKKIDAILEWPTPRSVKEIQSFLGLANYYRGFIKDFSAVAAPMTNATRGKKNEYHWGKKEQEAFDELKKRFSDCLLYTSPSPRDS